MESRLLRRRAHRRVPHLPCPTEGTGHSLRADNSQVCNVRPSREKSESMEKVVMDGQETPLLPKGQMTDRDSEALGNRGSAANTGLENGGSVRSVAVSRNSLHA